MGSGRWLSQTLFEQWCVSSSVSTVCSTLCCSKQGLAAANFTSSGHKAESFPLGCSSGRYYLLQTQDKQLEEHLHSTTVQNPTWELSKQHGSWLLGVIPEFHLDRLKPWLEFGCIVVDPVNNQIIQLSVQSPNPSQHSSIPEISAGGCYCSL